MERFLDILKSITIKIGDFFDIFDLSFFISGFASVGALIVWINLFGSTQIKELINPTNINIFVIIIACYIIGLINFASGRNIRIWFLKLVAKLRKEKYYTQLKSIIISHKLDKHESYKEYLTDNKKLNQNMWRLYIRLWAEIRENSNLLLSYNLIRRYWVLAAIFDGLMMSLFLWVVVLIYWIFQPPVIGLLSPSIGWPLVGIIFIVSLFCSREAYRYAKFQMEELVATLALKKVK
ncbi:MAG: hypothetical protein JXJ04_00405 [Spirochaetales bacterium]|nr:hypothetical protein [Spirochaetales bacterium]